MTQQRWIGQLLIGLALGAGILAMAGCSETLEDGYKPRALNATPAQRRGYYASPFSQEAIEGNQEAPGGEHYHKPGSF